MKKAHKIILLAGAGIIVLAASWQMWRLVDLWFIAPSQPPRIVALESRLEGDLTADGALGIGEHSNPKGRQDIRIKVDAQWLDDDRLQVVVQRRNVEFMTQVELWLQFRPPLAPFASARAGSMPLDSPYVWPLIRAQGTIAVNAEGASFSRGREDAMLILEYHVEGVGSGSPQETEQRIVLASADLR